MAAIIRRQSPPSILEKCVEDKPDPVRFRESEVIASELFRKAEKAKMEMDKRARDHWFG